MGAQSHVHVSFDSPEYTADVNGLGTLRILEAIRNLDLTHKTRFYQASTSELYGKIQSPQQSESTPFYPRSPYAVAKLFAYWTVINYREAYGLYGCNGILFNHESAMRGTSFVTRKITYTLSRIAYGLIDKLYLGNMNALRDWGHARDYVEMQWLMLQQEQPEDYVIASGERRSVREFVEVAAREIGFSIEWRGQGVDEVGLVSEVDPEKIGATFGKGRFKLKPGDEIVNIDPYYFRPTEVDVLWGDASKAREKLNWSPKTSFLELVSEMVAEDLEQARKQVVVNQYE
ncbi:hypothetical protein MACH26_32780 [Planctobacterium marinum]|uniref:GDP-mannose 4,6-dehydratase n=1 Tax=Planctobacterium marinum TaxID=1631968 RepID=A0AA48KT23_9ALTE|nr:hypothetical protein MACH26_32780 [Planctobacterium marinum]